MILFSVGEADRENCYPEVDVTRIEIIQGVEIFAGAELEFFPV